MIIRQADLQADALAIFDGARDFIARMDFTDFLPDGDDKLAACIGRVFALDGVEIVVAEESGRIIGGIGMLYAPFLWNTDIIVADELFIWTHPDAPKTTLLRLLRFVENRLTAMGATMKEFVTLTSSPAGVDRLYRRMGMRPVQTLWMGAV